MKKPTVLLVVPANNTTMEGEMTALCPEVGTFLTARVKRAPGLLTLADLPSYGDSTIAAVEPFLGKRIDLVVYGCTAAGFIGGREGNEAIVDRLAARTGGKVVSTAGAMVAALAHSGARRVDIVTPYLAAVNEGLRRFVSEAGIVVTALDSFLCPDVGALGRVSAAEVEAKALLTARDGDTLFIACSQLPTLPILGGLRARLGRPVWSSVSATAWMALAALGFANERLDGGRRGAAARSAA
jgi:maleate cis-trans isomerase